MGTASVPADKQYLLKTTSMSITMEPYVFNTPQSKENSFCDVSNKHDHTVWMPTWIPPTVGLSTTLGERQQQMKGSTFNPCIVTHVYYKRKLGDKDEHTLNSSHFWKLFFKSHFFICFFPFYSNLIPLWKNKGCSWVLK